MSRRQPDESPSKINDVETIKAISNLQDIDNRVNNNTEHRSILTPHDENEGDDGQPSTNEQPARLDP